MEDVMKQANGRNKVPSEETRGIAEAAFTRKESLLGDKACDSRAINSNMRYRCLKALLLNVGRAFWGGKSDTLQRYFEATAICGLLVIFCVFDMKSFAGEYESVDVSLMNYINSLSFNLKGCDVKIKEITMRETFDDNITYAKEEPKEDLITNLGLGMSAQYEGRKSTLEVAGNVYHEVFAENSNLDNTAQDIALNFKRELSQYDRISIKNVFTNTTVPLFFEGPTFSANLQGDHGRIPYYKNRFTIDYARDVFRQLTVKIKYANDVDAFETKTLLDSFTNKVGFETNYFLTATTMLLSTYDFSHRQFEDKSDVSINTIAQGLRQYITKKLYFDVGGGLDFVDSFEEETFIKPVVLSALVYSMSENTQLRLLFNKRDETSPFDKQIFNYWRTSLSFTRQVSERLGCNLSLSYTDGESIPSNFEQKILGASSTLTYDINKYLKGSLIYAYSQADSVLETVGYTKNTLSLGLTAAF